MRTKITLVTVIIAATLGRPTSLLGDRVTTPAVTLENEYFKYSIAANGRNFQFVDKKTGTDYCDRQNDSSFASITVGKQRYPATEVFKENGRIRVKFALTEVTALIHPKVYNRYIVFEVVSLEGGGVESFTFLDVPLILNGNLMESFAACALALNLQTKVEDLPGPTGHLKATCYRRFDFTGAKVALIGCPRPQLRAMLKEVVAAAEDLPRSDISGPWALDSRDNKASYILVWEITEKNVDDWIEVARQLGVNQIDFHGGSMFRFGDFVVNQDLYPRGRTSLKAVIDRLHAADIKAGLHTYSFLIDKECPWVTPVPDPRLAKDAVFTLAFDISVAADLVSVEESTEKMSSIYDGWMVRNSLTLQIDDELITYKGISKELPYAFIECQRGALGTQVASHQAGARVYHLKEHYRRFGPDGESTLLTEVAQATADIYNECGFDMLYFDALDSQDMLHSWETGWHYGSKFVYEVFRRLNRPAIMEMATFHHHLWVVRARYGAWDQSSRAFKRFVDIHSAHNEIESRAFLPMQLGWQRIRTPWRNQRLETTFTDDLEYLLCKCVGHDVGFSFYGKGLSGGQYGLKGNLIDALKEDVALRDWAAMIRQYEDLRRQEYFDEAVRAKLRDPGKDFKLFQDAQGQWRFRRILYDKHSVQGINHWSSSWPVDNPYDAQPVKLRIEARMSAGPYDGPDYITVADFSAPAAFSDQLAAPGVTLELHLTSDQVKVGHRSAKLTGLNAGKVDRRGAWAKASKSFDPMLDLSKHQALGVWIHGDGQGQVLNIQVKSPKDKGLGIVEHYIDVDFIGWRYFELIERDSERHSEFDWPYDDIYSIYRDHNDYAYTNTLGLWYNDLAVNKKSTCYISPVRALPLVAAKLKNPAITIGGQTIRFPLEMEPGSYLEFFSSGDCKYYDPGGRFLGNVQIQGAVPDLQSGLNEVIFDCDGPTDVSARARVTVICDGDSI